MKKKVLLIVLSALVVLGLQTAVAFGTEIEGSLPNADSNGEINLSGNTYKLTNKFEYSGSAVTITNGVISTDLVDAIAVNSGKVTLGSSLIVNASKGAAIDVEGGELIIDGATVNGGAGNACAYVGSGSLTVKSGTLSGANTALAVVKSGTASIEGGTITAGGTTIRAGASKGNAESPNGVITVKGGEVKSTSEEYCTAWACRGGKIIVQDNGVITAGGNSALVATANSTVEVTGGTVNAGTGNYYAVAAHEGNATANISGGTINGTIGVGTTNPGSNNTVTISGTPTINGSVSIAEGKGTASVTVSSEDALPKIDASHVWTKQDDETYISENAAVAKAVAAKEAFMQATTMDWETLIRAARTYTVAYENYSTLSQKDKDTLDTLKSYYTSISTLDMSGKKIAEQTYYDGTDAGSLAIFTGLTSLNLSDTGVTAIGALENLTSLRYLDLSKNTALAEKGAIAKLTNLETLGLEGTGFTNNDFGPIVALTTKLNDLNLSNNPALSAIGPLAACKGLESLNVSDTGLTQLQEVASFDFILKNITAQNLTLSTNQAISGLVVVTQRTGFTAENVTKWDLTGSIMSNDDDNHRTMVSNVLGDKFAAPKAYYKVTFDSDGGSSVDAQSVLEGETATAPTDPTKDGYVFNGWYAEDATAAYDFTTTVTANLALKAQWKVAYTVTFNTNGGSAVDSQTVATGEKAEQPTAPTRTGYTFAGWFADSDLTQAYDFNTVITANTTLYAKWTANSSGGGGTTTPTKDDPKNIKATDKASAATDGTVTLTQDKDFTLKDGGADFSADYLATFTGDRTVKITIGNKYYEFAVKGTKAAEPTEADKAAAGDVSKAIDALPAEITAENADAVAAARAAYDKLTPAQQALVPATTYAKLTAAEGTITYLNDVAAAKALTVKITKAKNVKGKKAKVTYKTTGTTQTGYQVKYATNKKLKKAKTKTIKKATTKKVTVKKLKKGKTYYFKVRTYTEVTNPVSGEVEKVYGKWSKVKKAKIKK